jgi:hypothetical protein
MRIMKKNLYAWLQKLYLSVNRFNESLANSKLDETNVKWLNQIVKNHSLYLMTLACNH